MVLQQILDILVMISQVYFEYEHVLMDAQLEFQFIYNTHEKHEM